jgi:hypothetical protein
MNNRKTGAFAAPVAPIAFLLVLLIALALPILA